MPITQLPDGSPKLEFSPIGGVNTTNNNARLSPYEVEDARNFLFDRLEAENRPGLSTTNFVNVVGPCVFGAQIVVNGTEYNMVIGDASRLWHYPGIEITPAAGAASFGNAAFNNACSIIGLVVFGNNAGGIVIWNPAGSTYVLVNTAKYRYVTGHKGRAVAAYVNAGGSALLNARTFAWSKPGDITTWTAADGSAGNEAIGDINDEITGLGVLHDIVVILRSFGVHLAYPTGTLPLPYDVQAFGKFGPGCYYPSTTAWWDEFVCYVGQEDVYRFDLQKVEPIGFNIRDTLIPLLRSGVLYNGFFTHTTASGRPRIRYHLMPVASVSSPHFCFDFITSTWSMHDYAIASQWAWDFAPILTSGATDLGTSFIDSASPPLQHFWNQGAPCERVAYFRRYMGVVEALEADFQITDVMLHNRDFGAVNATVELTATLNNADSTVTATKIVGTVAATGKWARSWMGRTTDLQVVGNDFSLKVSAAAGTQFSTDYVALKMPQSGEYRGA